MSKFWQKKYISKYTGAEIDAAVAKAGDATKVTANPTLAGTEAALTGLEVGTTKYKVEQPINVVANPTLAGTEAALEGLQVGETKYKIDAGGGGVASASPITVDVSGTPTTEEMVTLNVTGEGDPFQIKCIFVEPSVLTDIKNKKVCAIWSLDENKFQRLLIQLNRYDVDMPTISLGTSTASGYALHTAATIDNITGLFTEYDEDSNKIVGYVLYILPNTLDVVYN